MASALENRLKRLEQKAVGEDYTIPEVDIVYVEPDGSRSEPIPLKDFFARGEVGASKETLA